MDAEGGSLNAIIGAFGNSDEFNRRYGGLSYPALVTKIYQQALGRDPDPAGLAYYVGELQAGRRTLQSITLDVLNGATTRAGFDGGRQQARGGRLLHGESRARLRLRHASRTASTRYRA